MMDDQFHLGPHLRTARRAAHLTQEELAERAGVSARTISDIERGLRNTVYRDTAERLATALQLEGSGRAEFIELVRRSARRGPPRAAAAAGEVEVPAARLPTPRTSLIGRERELEVVTTALRSEEVRLLTLTGPGGIGKTRIAVQVATRVRAAGTRAFFVPLGAVHEPALVGSTVAAAIGLASEEEPNAEAICGYLGSPPALLVLDTFEHLLDAAGFVADLVARCTGLKVMITSREALHLSSEHELIVPSLGPHGASAEAGDDGRGDDAVELFMDRARAARPGLAFDAASRAVIREICARLDGLPLAIELAAARLRHLSLRALHDMLDHSLTVLVGGPLDLPRRHRTMRDTIAWSYGLLNPKERDLFRHLGVFAGGWTLDAAWALHGDANGSRETPTLLSGLIEKNLVLLADAPGGDVRYSMFDIIREFAWERCREAGESDALRQRHAELYLRFAEETEPLLRRADQGTWFQRLQADHANLRAALGWFLETGDGERALRLAGALWLFWRRQGHVSEGRMRLREALRLGQGDAGAARAKALWGAGWLSFAQGRYAEAEAYSIELRDLADQLGSRLDERNALTVLGMTLMARGSFDEAIVPFDRAVEICRQLGADWHLATSKLNLGMARMHAGQLHLAEEVIEEARRMYEDLEDEQFAARCVAYLGYSALLGGATGRAESLFADSLTAFLDLDDLQGVAEGLEGLAGVNAAKAAEESIRRAALLAGVASSIRERLSAPQYVFDTAGMEPYLSTARALLGDVAWEHAWTQGRRMPLEEAARVALGLGDS